MTNRSVCVASLLALAACSFPLSEQEPPPKGGPTPLRNAPFGDTVESGTTVNGFTWDPEAFLLSLVRCGTECPVPPLQMPGIPHLTAALVKDAEVTLFDPLEAQPTLAARTPTGEDGLWRVEHVARREAPYLPFSRVPPQTDAGAAPSYLPTLTARPVYPGPGECLGVSALQMSTQGALDAVARFLTVQQGNPFTVEDLLDPTKTGGVVVWWLYAAGPASLRVPAAGTFITASAGQTFHINWAPPGILPTEAAPLQSPLGFFVGDPSERPLGLTVTVLPPLSGPPEPITFDAVDPFTNAEQGRPWTFPPLPPLVVAPGVITAGELQGALAGASGSGAPPTWACVLPTTAP